MTELHPSIINAMRRAELNKYPNRNVIPAQRTPENELENAEPEEPRTLGRLATLAGNVRLMTRSQLTGGPGENI